jgi:hypothetical protein
MFLSNPVFFSITDLGKYFLHKKLLISSLKYGFGIRDPGKTYPDPQCCGTVMIFCGSGSGSDIGKVSVVVPDPDNIKQSFSTTKN